MYSIEQLFFQTLVGIVCGCNNWEEISIYGKLKKDWFGNYFFYKKGMPSEDTFERFFGALCKESFNQFFINWASKSFQYFENEVISIDGKRIRGSYDKAIEQSAVHVVSAYASENRLTLGQVATAQKSNEITAIPQLLDLIDVKDAVVSIDAMGCQKEIAKKIRSKEAHYLLAVKENQKELHQNIIQSFEKQAANQIHEWNDMGHGRIEKRTCELITTLDWMENIEQWQDLRTIIKISSERTIKNTGQTQLQTRYYISSKTTSAENFNKMIRSHWAIENNLHWNLDVIFKEDAARRRKGNSAYNFNIISKIALKIIEMNKQNRSKKITRLRATVDDDFRTEIFKKF